MKYLILAFHESSRKFSIACLYVSALKNVFIVGNLENFNKFPRKCNLDMAELSLGPRLPNSWIRSLHCSRKKNTQRRAKWLHVPWRLKRALPHWVQDLTLWPLQSSSHPSSVMSSLSACMGGQGWPRQGRSLHPSVLWAGDCWEHVSPVPVDRRWSLPWRNHGAQ